MGEGISNLLALGYTGATIHTSPEDSSEDCSIVVNELILHSNNARQVQIIKS